MFDFACDHQRLASRAGGHVVIRASAADGIVQNLVTRTGSISANSVGPRHGPDECFGQQRRWCDRGWNAGLQLDGWVSGDQPTDDQAAKGSSLTANATSNGPGGKIAMLSTQNTKFAGSASARGGPGGGNGGLVSVGSGRTLSITGTTDVSAPHGRPGTTLRTGGCG